MKISKADKAKLTKTIAIVVVWGIAIVGLGSTLGKKSASELTVVSSSSDTRKAIMESNSSEQAKSQKLKELNLQAVIKGMKKTEAFLGISDWEKPVSKARDGIPALQVYFPQGQSMDGWQESFVLRSFVNITLPNPAPVVYDVYAEWLKTQVPDIQLSKTQDSTGVYFHAQSKTEGIYMTGKVYSGAVKEAVHISQYAIKSSTPDAQEKATQWKANFSKIN